MRIKMVVEKIKANKTAAVNYYSMRAYVWLTVDFNGKLTGTVGILTFVSECIHMERLLIQAHPSSACNGGTSYQIESIEIREVD
jgi:hypothetical protein